MATILDLPEIRAHVHVWQVTDYLGVAEDHPAFRRSELIRGIIVEKMPKTSLHEFLTKAIYDFFLRAARAEMVVRQNASLQLADSVPEPDIAVVRGVAADFRARHPTTAELVVEVAVTSLALDREKALLYAEADVGEYWIVLADTEQVEVYRQPVGGAYRETRVYVRGESIEGVRVTTHPVPVDALFT
jgi:Uma2 family endonuclease